jgi:hypothetical protein
MRVRWLGVAIPVLVLLAACSAPAAPRPAAPGSESPTSRTDATFAAVGDSITVVHSTEFSAGVIDPDSWVAQVPSKDLRFVGGWAERGSSTALMRAGAAPVDADVLVIMAGTNDVLIGVPLSTTEANLVAIRRIVGGRAVVVSAIAPDDTAPAATAAFNTELESFVAAQGWTWVDPWTSVRSGQEYGTGMSVDGIHPTPAAARPVGVAMRAAIRSAAGLPR